MENFDFAGKMGEMGKGQNSFVVATVIRTEGSSLAKPGFKVIIQNGSIVYGTLGGACPESVIIDEAEKTLKTGKPSVIRVHLEESKKGTKAMIARRTREDIYVETFCGGVIEIYLEPFLPSQRLVIVGQGGKDEIEDDLVLLGKKLNFNVVVVDHAPNLSNQPDRLITELDYSLLDLKLGPNDFVVVLTKGDRDISVLQQISQQEPAYVGLLASRNRITHDFEILKANGVSEDFLRSVHAPIGINIGAVSPFEIAVSIASEIISVRRLKETQPVAESV
ncbi:MAG: XdhC family protein [Thermoplasmataceae archaeon]